MKPTLVARVRPAPRLPPVPVRRRRGVARSPAALALLATGGVLAGAVWLTRAPSGPAEAPAAPALAWTPLEADAAPSLLVRAGAGEALRLERAERHGSGARREWLRAVGADASATDARLLVTLGPALTGIATERAPPTAFLAAARLAARMGRSVLSASEPVLARTRFGPAETAEIELLPADARPVRCEFLRLPRTPDGLALTVLRCQTATPAAPSPPLRCLLDRLDLAATADPALRTAFADAQPLGPPACPALLKAEEPASAPAPAPKLAPEPAPTPRVATRPNAGGSPAPPARTNRERGRS